MGKNRSVNNVVEFQPVRGKTPNQQRYIDSILDCDIVLCTGYPGTGKTFISMSLAADWYKKEKHRRIIVTRPMVSNGDDIGFLPGNETEKAIPWAHAPLDVLKSRLGMNTVECDIKNERIIVKPLQMMQGASFDDAWVIVDEAQEITVSQAKMIVTRIGVNSKLILNGDIRQKNIDELSGLEYLVNLIKRKGLDIPIVDMEIDDCVRSKLCREMIEAIYE